MGSYLAHVAEDGRQQTVLQHLSATAQKCTAFAQVFHAEVVGIPHLTEYIVATRRMCKHQYVTVKHMERTS